MDIITKTLYIQIDSTPLLPSMLKSEFPELYASRPLREALCAEYERTYTWLRREEAQFELQKS